MCCKASFVSNAPDDLSKGSNCIVIYNEITIDLVGLVKFMKGSFKKLPQYGDTFFQLEKVEGQAGMLILVIIYCLYFIVIR